MFFEKQQWPGIFACVLGLLAACGGASAPRRTLSYGDKAAQAYSYAMEDFRDDNCLDAEPAFRKVWRNYSYSRYAALAELRVADCMLIQDKYVEAISAYREFIRTRPSHPEIPYAEYKIAEAYVKQIPDDWLLSPPAHQRDQGPTRRALQQLRHYIMEYPSHDRVPNAKKLARRALALLARHEMYVAEFYLDRDQPKAAIGRLQVVLNAYQGSGVEPKAALLLGQTYLKLRDHTSAYNTFQDLAKRYPKTEEALQARSYLKEIGTPAVKAEPTKSPAQQGLSADPVPNL